MDLDLKELGLTLIIGTFTILGLEAIFYYVFELQITGLFPTRKKEVKEGERHTTQGEVEENEPKVDPKVQPMKAVLFIGIAFAVGMLAEDLSYKYVDTAKTPFTSLRHFSASMPWSNSPALHDKDQSRVHTLIKNHGQSDESIEPLAIELAHNRAFSLVYPEVGTKFENWVLGEECKSNHSISGECLSKAGSARPSDKEILTSINGLYYYAKNRAYSNEQYYTEMSKIESRRDFSRSVFLIAFLYLILAIPFGLGRMAWLIRNPIARGDGNLKRRSLTTLLVWVILSVIYGLSLLSYQQEADEFNKRSFGYFSSMLFTDRLAREQETNTQFDATTPDRRPSPQPTPK
jgi:hypothetical protein